MTAGLMMNGRLTRLQVGVAACAVAVAAAVPTVSANAQPMPNISLDSLTSVLSEPMLAPVNIAEAPCLPGDVGCAVFTGFGAILLTATAFVFIPIAAALTFIGAIASAVVNFFFGPYGVFRA